MRGMNAWLVGIGGFPEVVWFTPDLTQRRRGQREAWVGTAGATTVTIEWAPRPHIDFLAHKAMLRACNQDGCAVVPVKTQFVLTNSF